MARTSLTAIATVVLLSMITGTRVIAIDMDGVMMSDGKMVMMKGGKPAVPMDHEMTMSDGTKVETDGTVKSKDGKVSHLRNEQMIMMDGHVMQGGNPKEMHQ